MSTSSFKFAMALALVLLAGGLASLSARRAPDADATSAATTPDEIVSAGATTVTGRRQPTDP
jgi:hypothetical protein